MQARKILLYTSMPIIIAGVLLVIAHVHWLQQNNKPLSVYVLDKTVPTDDYTEHKSLFWMLSNNKIVKDNAEPYKVHEDYWGFFPLNKEEQLFEIRTTNIDAIEATADANDICYYTDTYGVYYNQWYQADKKTPQPSGKVFGGLNNNDYLLLKAFKARRKLILAEFNLYNGPTPNLVRAKVEQLLGLQWSGWTGKYYRHLDTTKQNAVPGWIVNRYKEQNHNLWPFKGSGVVLVHKYGKILVLDYPQGEGAPKLKTDPVEASRYGVPQSIPFERWFDISYVTDTTHKTLAEFQLQSTPRDSLLKPMGVTKQFPAIIRQSEHYQFYYFAGDFADMQVPMWTAKITGSRRLHKLFSSGSKQFMWDYYQPLMDKILTEYVKQDTYGE